MRALEFAYPHRMVPPYYSHPDIDFAGAGVIEPLIMKYIFDRIADEAVFLIITGVAGFLILAVVKESSSGLSSWLIWRTRLTIHYRLLSEIVERLHRLPFDYHRKARRRGYSER